MSKTSKKRGFPKISKWGKFLKLKRSKKKEKKTILEEEKLEHDELELNDKKTRKDQETTALIVEKPTEINVLELKEEAKKLEEEIESESCSTEEEKAAVKTDLCQKFEQDASKNGGSSSHVLVDRNTELENIEVVNENGVKPQNDNDLRSADNENSSPKDASLILDQVSEVIVHTPSPKHQEEQDMKMNNDEKDEVLAFPILPTPPSKTQKSDYKIPNTLSVKEDEKNDFDKDDVFVAGAVSTPRQKRQENRDSRVSTVKKIRSIIATPYKRLKREGSLLDGQTYRYIEIQSLVNAFQSMHPCIGSMMACNEKGLQYGKSSVLRIECKECNAKVFLQASKN